MFRTQIAGLTESVAYGGVLVKQSKCDAELPEVVGLSKMHREPCL